MILRWPSQYHLGTLYLDGDGVKQNDVRAYGWFSICIRDMNDVTPEVMVELIDRMEPGLRLRAVQLAKRYKSRYFLADDKVTK